MDMKNKKRPRRVFERIRVGRSEKFRGGTDMVIMY